MSQRKRDRKKERTKESHTYREKARSNLKTERYSYK